MYLHLQVCKYTTIAITLLTAPYNRRGGWKAWPHWSKQKSTLHTWFVTLPPTMALALFGWGDKWQWTPAWQKSWPLMEYDYWLMALPPMILETTYVLTAWAIVWLLTSQVVSLKICHASGVHTCLQYSVLSRCNATKFIITYIVIFTRYWEIQRDIGLDGNGGVTEGNNTGLYTFFWFINHKNVRYWSASFFHLPPHSFPSFFIYTTHS